MKVSSILCRKWLFAALLIAIASTAAQAGDARLAVWQVDSMQKVFQDDSRTQPAEVLIEAARNEVVSFQVVAWCDQPMEKLTCVPGKMMLQAGGKEIPAPCVRYVGYVGIRNKPVKDPLRPRPAVYPDPLYDAPNEKIPAKTAQPIWLTYHVPADAAPGDYRSSIEVQAAAGGEGLKAAVNVRLKVYATLLPQERTLKVSNWPWFDTPKVSAFCGVEQLHSEPFWKLMEQVAEDMAEHRQNCILTPTTAWTWLRDDPVKAEDLIVARAGKDGRLEFDFTRFDRWVTIFLSAGVDGLIEGSHLAHRRKETRGDREYQSVTWAIESGRAVKRMVPSDSPEYEKYLSAYLPALQEHLRQKGWLGRYAQHILDEPNGERRAVYVKLAARVRKYAPQVRRIDATQISDLEGSIDIWVPTINHLTHDWETYKQRQAQGQELWFYTMGRPVEQALTRVRLWQWGNFATKTTGYLHWGYNWWVRSPDPQAGKWTLAPGDEWIVYPKPGGVYDSIRFESMLEGIQDYELLQNLAKRDPKAADEICQRLFRLTPDGPDRYAVDDRVDSLRSARRALLAALSR